MSIQHPRSLEGKVAIVTGGTRGIGRAVVMRLLREKMRVVVNYREHSLQLDSTLNELNALGDDAEYMPFCADVTKPIDVDRMFQEALQKWGSIDLLVNNAGVALYKKIADVTDAEFAEVFNTNVKATFLTCRAAAERMNEGGNIINLSSSVTRLMLPTYGVYAASKGAVEQLSRVLAKELGPKKIRVNCIAPGPTDTDLFRKGKNRETTERLAQMSAFNRLGLPDDVANAIVALASHDAAWITGQVIGVNGGFA